MGRPQTAGQHDDIGPLARARNSSADTPDVVADRSREVDVDTDVGELTTEPRGVSVDDVAEQQFGADRDNLCLHGWVAFTGGSPSRGLLVRAGRRPAAEQVVPRG